MSDEPRMRLCAAPPEPPCTCGRSGACLVCVLEDLSLEAALMSNAIGRTELACGLEGTKP